ncbi:hypothetical protein I3760_09G104100 [Carya illinoinensis]|uniref:Cytochrome P450 n=1 Tax=Carya illinoinensis TaxID=32201 RepID=A0A8T1PB80_CARIL|nr:premnaspirodiene oxygenase-like [Carya illinoinensis]KAG2688602.1 hypothetical protein I3760_09G104100 [Carya illinoinensis]KAG6641906.1 hypothetical protein CIPAW_09G106400 [Carya illinoinensis]KAG6695552.1 hypothetical protein I3842_09G103900 [Carya illinoinensis]
MALQYSLALITTFFLLLLPLIWLIKRCRRSAKVQKLPPGPWKLPLIGNLHNLVGSLPHHALRELARKYGPLMHLQLGEVSAVVATSPRIAREFLKTHDLALGKRQEVFSAKTLTYDGSDIVFSPFGDYWRQMRKVCVMELLSAKRVQSFSSLREDEVCNLIESIRLYSGSPINFTEKIYSLTSTIVCKAAFGSKCKDPDVFISLTREAISAGGGFDLADLFPSQKFLRVITGKKTKVEEMHRKLDRILENIIHEHKENQMSAAISEVEPGQEDLVDFLLRLQQSSGLEVPITTKNIKAVIWDMFAAGTDTSSTTVVWGMLEMMRNPTVLEKAQAEIRQAFGGKKKIHEKDVGNLSYLKLVIQETLRLHPPLPVLIPRECTEPCEIDGYEIPVKTKVIINAWAIARDPAYWNHAESFMPERFAGSSTDFRGTSFEFIPFGAGRRMCPGLSFGLANVELPLAQLLYHFDWELPGRTKPEDLDMSETVGAVAARKKPLYMIATAFTPPVDESRG